MVATFKAPSIRGMSEPYYGNKHHTDYIKKDHWLLQLKQTLIAKEEQPRISKYHEPAGPE